jgi:hypothetical protein
MTKISSKNGVIPVKMQIYFQAFFEFFVHVLSNLSQDGVLCPIFAERFQLEELPQSD